MFLSAFNLGICKSKAVDNYNGYKKKPQNIDFQDILEFCRFRHCQCCGSGQFCQDPVPTIQILSGSLPGFLPKFMSSEFGTKLILTFDKIIGRNY
jgi:hypothetical protein